MDTEQPHMWIPVMITATDQRHTSSQATAMDMHLARTSSPATATDTDQARTSRPGTAMGTGHARTSRPGMAMGTGHARTSRPGTAMDTVRLCQAAAPTVDHDRPMRLRCRHDRAWPCPIGTVIALPGTVTEACISGRSGFPNGPLRPSKPQGLRISANMRVVDTTIYPSLLFLDVPEEGDG